MRWVWTPVSSRAHAPRALVWGVLALAACGRPCDLGPAAARIAARWPTAGEALRDRDVYGRDAVWYWAHGRRSVDGFGATLALVDRKPSLRVFIDPIDDLHAGHRFDHPSLLFFDQDRNAARGWRLVGMGWHFDFDPCARPTVRCVDPDDFLVHEAGYHRVPLGDGGMTPVTAAQLHGGLVPDPEGCVDIDDADVTARPGTARHGRAWTLHAWLAPEGGAPEVSLRDPWQRWSDAPNRVAVDPSAFFRQGDCPCAEDSGG